MSGGGEHGVGRLRGTKILFCRRGFLFTPNTLSPVILFWLNTLKGNAEAPAVDLLKLRTLRGTKITFLTPKRYYEHPTLFIWESPPGLFVATCFETSKHQLSRTLAIGKENGHNQPIFFHKRLNNGFTNYCRY